MKLDKKILKQKHKESRKAKINLKKNKLGGGGNFPDQIYQEFIESQKMRQCGIGIGRVK